MSKVIMHFATAGTLESSDAFVTVEPSENGLEIEIDSVVQKQFGKQILEAVQEVLREQGIEKGKVSVVDRGALDCVIRARVETAALRGKGEEQ